MAAVDPTDKYLTGNRWCVCDPIHHINGPQTHRVPKGQQEEFMTLGFGYAAIRSGP